MSDAFVKGFIAQGRADGDSDATIREAAYIGWTKFGFISAEEYFNISATLWRESKG